MVLNLQVEKETTIVWPSPFGIRIRQLGLSFTMGKLQHTILNSSSNFLSKQK
jgi:hypothetical protein